MDSFSLSELRALNQQYAGRCETDLAILLGFPILHRSIGKVAAVVETPTFLHDARAVGLSEAERLSIVMWLAANPDAGDVIEGTGGARRVRFAGRGKGGAADMGLDIPVFLLNVFAKNEKTDLAPKERQILKAIVTNLVNAYKVQRRLR